MSDHSVYLTYLLHLAKPILAVQKYKPTMKTILFERLGGKSGITALVHEAVEAHMENSAISKRFQLLREQPERLAEIIQHSIDFFGAGSGGNIEYSGRDMVSAHRGMNISPSEYMHVIDDILGAMQNKGLDQETQDEVLGILWSLKGMIIAQ